jgi:hypothetical protein
MLSTPTTAHPASEEEREMSDNNEFTVIEINGVKMGVDLRRAKILHEELKIGSRVRIMIKNDYSGPQVHTGVIVGFDAFPDLPTIHVAYVVGEYNGADLKFAFVNAKTDKSFTIVPAADDDLPIKKEDLMASFDRKVEKLESDIRELQDKKRYFTKYFDQFFQTENVSV